MYGFIQGHFKVLKEKTDLNYHITAPSSKPIPWFLRRHFVFQGSGWQFCHGISYGTPLYKLKVQKCSLTYRLSWYSTSNFRKCDLHGESSGVDSGVMFCMPDTEERSLGPRTGRLRIAGGYFRASDVWGLYSLVKRALWKLPWAARKGWPLTAILAM